MESRYFSLEDTHFEARLISKSTSSLEECPIQLGKCSIWRGNDIIRSFYAIPKLLLDGSRSWLRLGRKSEKSVKNTEGGYERKKKGSDRVNESRIRKAILTNDVKKTSLCHRKLPWWSVFGVEHCSHVRFSWRCQIHGRHLHCPAGSGKHRQGDGLKSRARRWFKSIPLSPKWL